MCITALRKKKLTISWTLGDLTSSQPGAFQEGEIKKEENKIVHQARSCEFTDVMLLVSLLRKIFNCSLSFFKLNIFTQGN